MVPEQLDRGDLDGHLPGLDPVVVAADEAAEFLHRPDRQGARRPVDKLARGREDQPLALALQQHPLGLQQQRLAIALRRDGRHRAGRARRATGIHGSPPSCGWVAGSTHRHPRRAPRRHRRSRASHCSSPTIAKASPQALDSRGSVGRLVNSKVTARIAPLALAYDQPAAVRQPCGLGVHLPVQRDDLRLVRYPRVVARAAGAERLLRHQRQQRFPLRRPDPVALRRRHAEFLVQRPQFLQQLRARDLVGILAVATPMARRRFRIARQRVVQRRTR